MKALLTRISIVLSCVALFAGLASAQISGVPGDGVPDAYYFTADGLTALTSQGSISRPAGTMIIDTDGTDMVAVIISGPVDAVTGAVDDGSFLTGLTSSLPDPNNPPLFFSSWSAGFNANGGQWLRGNPDNTDGFDGVVGDTPDDPLNLFPDVGLADYGLGATFEAGLDDGTGTLWEVTTATNGGDSFFTDVTPVMIPEPSSLALLGIALLGLIGRRR